MRPLVLVWLALPLLALAPPAQACVPPGPPSFDRLAAAGEEGSVLTEADGAIVRYRWSDGSFANLTPFARPGRWAASPDGAWIVKVEARWDDACRLPRSAASAVPATGGAAVALEGEGLDLLAAGARHVALSDPREGEVRLYEWGRWEEPARRLRPDLAGAAGAGGAGDEPGDYGARALSADGLWLALAGHGVVHLIDARTGEQADRAHLFDPVQASAAAFSPDGRGLAVLSADGYASSRLWVYEIDVGHLALMDVEAFGQTPLGLAWGRGGLVATFNDRDAPREDARGVARTFPDPSRLAESQEARFPVHELTGDPLWQEGRLVVGVRQGIAVLDASLRPVLWSFPGRPASFDEPFWAPTPAPRDAGPTTTTPSPPGTPPATPPAAPPATPPDIEARRVDAPPALAGALVAAAAILGGRRRR